ncbi:uncharacterized protein LOC142570927 isoform X1 [Dermacentor variabilis]|uniref:uncharacterized protein LOC142570927 isoform X1 n=1 Tax=Dermacentor variabilis TaxID=34621 RepID=UPI003F5B0EE3
MSRKSPKDAHSSDKNFLGQSVDESVLTGWYSVINWLLQFILTDPIDALRAPRATSGAALRFGHGILRRWNPRQCALPTDAPTPYVWRGSNAGPKREHALHTTSVHGCLHHCTGLHSIGCHADARQYIRVEAVLTSTQQAVHSIRRCSGKFLEVDGHHFSSYLKAHILPEIKAATTMSAGGVMKADISDNIPPVAESVLEHGRLQTKEAAQDAMAQLIATSVTKTYNDSLTECRLLAKNGSDRIARFCQAVVADTEKSLRSFVNLSGSLVKTDQLGVLATLQHKSHWYIFLVLGSFLFLFLLYTGSFVMGMFHYNEDIPPTKRTDASNYAGTAMLL